MNKKTQHFENEGYCAEASEEAGCRLVLKVTLKPKSAQKAYKEAVKVVNKQISIPGFRKGKAPDKTVISRYASYVEQEWKEIVINDAYRASLELSNVYPLSKESIQRPKIESCSQEEGAVVHLSYEYYPHVPTVEFSEIKLPPIARAPIEDEKVSDILNEVKKAHADWENIEGRGVEEGDYADISIDSVEEDPPRQLIKERRFEVDSKLLPGWLFHLLLGLKVAESIEGESALDTEADKSAQENFKPSKMRITLHSIKKIVLPELDDALAKKAGAASLADLKDKIQHNLEKEAEEAQKRERVQALEDALVDKYRFDLPQSLVASETKERIAKRLNQQAGHSNQLEADIEKEIQAQVDRDLRLYFLNKQIAKQGNISLSNQELNDELMRYLSQNPQLYGKESNDAETRELVSRMATALMQRKTKEYALSQI